MHAGSSRLGLLLQLPGKSEKTWNRGRQLERGQKHYVVGVDDQKLGAGGLLVVHESH